MKKEERSLADPSRPWSIPPEAIEDARARARARPPLSPEVRKRVVSLFLAHKARRAQFPLTEALMVQDLNSTLPLRALWVAPLALTAAAKRLPRSPEVSGPLRDLLKGEAWALRHNASLCDVADQLNRHLTALGGADEMSRTQKRAADVLDQCIALLDACLLDTDVLSAAYAVSLGVDDLVVELLLLGCSQRDAVTHAASVGAPTPDVPASSLRATTPPLCALDHWGLWDGSVGEEW